MNGSIKIFWGMLCLLLSIGMNAQKVCNLTFVDAENKGCSDVAVKVFFNDEFHAGIYTDTLGTGSFEFTNEGSYRIETSSINYNVLDTAIVLSQSVENMKFTLISSDIALNTVTVTALRDIIKRGDEGITLKINGSNTLGSNVADILKNAPGVDVSSNSIEFLGKGVIVFIDGKRTNLRGNKLINYLKNKKSQRIEEIEMVLNPDASFDASFDGRIIKITTQKRIGDGYEFSLYSRLNRNRDYFSPDINGDVHIRSGDFSIYSDVGYYVSNKIERSNESRLFTDNLSNLSFDEESTNDYSAKGPYFEFGVDYEINERSFVGLKWEGSFDRETGNVDSNTDISSFGQIDSILVNENENFENVDFSNFNFNYNTTLDSGTVKINFDTDYATQKGNYGTFQQIQLRSIDNTELSSGINDQNLNVENDIFSSKIDILKKFDGYNFSFGGKYSKSESLQDIDELFQTSINSAPRYQDLVQYEETIYSTFANLKGRLAGYYFSIGARYEKTDYSGSANSIIDTVNGSYSKLFPQVVINKRLKKHSFTGAYKQSIRRPSYSQLIPYKRYSSALYYYTGNPNLRAYFPESLEFIYSFDNMIILKFANRRATNRILEYNRQIEGSLLTEGTKENNGSSNLNLFSLSFNKRLSSKLYIKTGATYIMGKQKADLTESEEFKYDAYTFTIAPRMSLSDKLNFSMYWYYSSDIYFGVSQNLSYWFLDFDLSYELFDGAAEIGIGGRDIFLKSITRGAAEYSNLIETSRNDWASRQLVLNFSYYFESDNVKSQRSRVKTANQESINRL
ncbi:MAG: outer membrane beta-barrel protein [Saprospiraceae bacterium]|nr:outer membrane beta-barrel protein [Saprospiraceae bacterium]